MTQMEIVPLCAAAILHSISAFSAVLLVVFPPFHSVTVVFPPFGHDPNVY